MRRRHDPKKGFPNHGHACVMGVAFRSRRRLSPAPHPVPMPLVTVVMAPSLSRGTSMAWCRLHLLAGGATLGTLTTIASFGPACVGHHREVCTRRAGHPNRDPAGTPEMPPLT